MARKQRIQDGAPDVMPAGHKTPGRPWELGDNPLVDWAARGDSVERYLFGSDAEATIYREPSQKYRYSGAAPSDVVPHFTAIRPGATSRSLNEPSLAGRSPDGPHKSSTGLRKYVPGA